MSRATDLRDALIAELKTLRPSDRIEPFWTPDFPQEWLEAGPVIGVRVAGREIEVMMGPDRRDVILEVAVFGLVASSSEATTDPRTHQSAQLAAGDSLDTLQEELINLWTPDREDGTPAPLSGRDGKGLADHSFVRLTQPVPFDAAAFIEFRHWASVFLVTYHDTRDD